MTIDGEYYDDENDEDEDLFHNGCYQINGQFYKHAQPVHKKYASTGFLCNRFGNFLAPIEESQDEPPLKLDKGLNQMPKQSSASCYDLVYQHLRNNQNKLGLNNRQLSYSQTSIINSTNTDENEQVKEIDSLNFITKINNSQNAINQQHEGDFKVLNEGDGLVINEPALTTLNQTHRGDFFNYM